jgi:ABC-type cobalamin transport system ATPase subunit
MRDAICQKLRVGLPVSCGRGEYLILAAKARAILTGSFHVTPDHIREIAKPVLRHRILTNFNAEADQVTTDAIIDNMIKEMQEQFDITSIVISHDMASTFRIASMVAMLYKGEIAAYGTPAEVRASPNQHVQHFIHAGAVEGS